MTAAEKVTSLHAISPTAIDEMQQLCKLLTGSDRSELIALRQQWQDNSQFSHKVAAVIAEAIAMRHQQDDAINRFIRPVIEHTIEQAIRENPNMVAEIFFPIIGAAVRKAIMQAMREMMQSINSVLEQGLSLRFIGWRINAWRSGQPYGQYVLQKTLLYQVEQVFLIHKETSLLIHHIADDSSVVHDPDMVSGMLSAIQDFVRDSFTVNQTDKLQSMQVGEVTVLVEEGPHAALALAVRGNYPQELHTIMEQTLESIHILHTEDLRNFSGDPQPFENSAPLLAGCFKRQLRETQRRFPMMALLLLLSCGAFAGWYSYQKFQQNELITALEQQQQQKWHNFMVFMRQQSGYVITDWSKESSGYVVTGLRDPLAPTVDMLLQTANMGGTEIDWRLHPYIALEESFVLQRLQQKLQPPDGVEVSLRQGVVYLSGVTEQEWFGRLQQMTLPEGVTAIDTTDLRQLPSTRDKITALQQKIDTTVFYYDAAEEEPQQTEHNRKLLQQLVADVLALAAFSEAQSMQLVVTGHTDTVGNPGRNLELSIVRAQKMRQQLIQQGVAATMVRAVGVGSQQALPASDGADSNDVNRRVTFTVQLP